MAVRGRSFVLCLLALQACVLRCCAWQPPYHAFQWTFGNNYLETELEECQNMTIVVESLSSNSSELGVPPYYLIAFELGGVPTTRMVGPDASKLYWQVGHREGSMLMLTMVDSNHSTGGVSPTLYNVTAGSNSSCLPSSSSSTDIARITPNLTSSLSTCEPWGLTITNGTKPYTMVLAALDSPIMTNATMGNDDDVFTYIDRANPDGQLLAAVVDANGQWGYATSTINTVGSTNNDCVGLISTSQTQAQIAAEAAARERAAEEAAKRRREDTIIGVVIGVGGALILMLTGAWLYRRRQLAIARGIWDGQDTRATGWVPDPDMGPPSVRSYKHVKNYSTDSATTATTSILLLSRTPPYEEQQAENRVLERSPTTPALPLPLASPNSRRNRKQQEASSSTSDAFGAPQLPNLAFSQLSMPMLRSPQGQTYTSLEMSDSDAQPDIIIQHRDGGVVQELPPPYKDYYRGTSSGTGTGSGSR
ncbi:uncharacterized protein LAESUDRAFT_752523 [Laetiporus sulphureus 93-53]|uniref:Mid2 domain-containing protein n=1 Tax=Laetiporus sulphureus 93-53 TaxID=1314785 RepID=A0A165BTX5_9APHY|nr:uncharacterized protein LAESUDRAFT_752523 [Laetiporus sulphureus 93-53]KZT01644.1 hypothetical protein LAESUDRAFT_752523 [Laetiporus sulphureus 93-53]